MDFLNNGIIRKSKYRKFPLTKVIIGQDNFRVKPVQQRHKIKENYFCNIVNILKKR